MFVRTRKSNVLKGMVFAAVLCCGPVFFINDALAQKTKAGKDITLANDKIKLKWVKTEQGWKLVECAARSAQSFLGFGEASGTYQVIYSPVKPADTALHAIGKNKLPDFPEQKFKWVYPNFQKAISSVPMNKAGKTERFLASSVQQQGDSLVFKSTLKEGVLEATWKLDQNFPEDILIRLHFTANTDGYFSLSSPTLSTLTAARLQWAAVPGYFQGNFIQNKFQLAYAYGQGLPAYPVLCRESTITTMSSIMSDKNGLSMAVIPEPGQDRNPYEKDKITHFSSWKVGLSHMNSSGQLSPTAYHPVLGETGSFLKVGEHTDLNIRVTLKKGDWYAVYKHAIYDIYRLKEYFKLEENKRSLTDRIMLQYDYVLNDKTALWNKMEYRGSTIMAQSYLADVVGSDHDAMKNSDIGAVWMLTHLTQDTLLAKYRVPFIRNFKVLQQNTNGFFKGAVAGQYFLAKKKVFTEEWGNHFEPIAITYYTMSDIGNMLLFEKNDTELKTLLKNGAERLLKWQHSDGSWVVAYDRKTHQPIYTDVKDLRPTFYGLLVAYKIFKDSKYLRGAIKGAKWLIRNGTEKASFLGVCGDSRFVNDFATIQCASALLDLYETTADKQYLNAALSTARMYTTSIYTHPMVSSEPKTYKQKTLQDWQLTQVGLNFEHGGSMGSAVSNGPILLVSHCGFFLRLYQISKDPLFRDLARIGALGRDAFVNPESGVASYYWRRFDEGPGQFPHHAWWQIGWIYDYLVSEAELRSNGTISFPRGFMTPKVGPHKPVGFQSGVIEKTAADLILKKGLVRVDNPNVDYLTAISHDKQYLFVVLLNDQDKPNSFQVSINAKELNTSLPDRVESDDLKPFGYKVIKMALSNNRP